MRRPSCVTLIVVLLVAACSVRTHPINPPNASIQQLDVLPDGRWKVVVRLENFSDKTVHFAELKASLRIAGEAAADIALRPELDIPGNNADVVETAFAPTAQARQAFLDQVQRVGGVAYELKGRISIPAAGKEFPFEHKSRLNPVPGIPDEYR
jgi:hypothetical protein